MENRETTVVNPHIGCDVLGYVVNTLLDRDSQQRIMEVQQRTVAAFGETIWTPPPEALHITLMDWIAPLADYGQNKDQLFTELSENYNTALEQALKEQSSIEIYFDTLKVAPDAIIMIGQDNGQMQQIRQKFLESVDLLPQTKRPPAIIHSSILRFQQDRDIQPIINFIAQERLSLNLAVSAFQLVRENVLPMLEYKVIREYKL